MPIPHELAQASDVPGAPLGLYTPPPVRALEPPVSFSMGRTARWHECDSLEHVNNTVYADWLDEAVRFAMRELGFPVADMKKRGLQLRGEHYRLDYRRAALPEDNLPIETRIVGNEGRLCAIEQFIRGGGEGELLTAQSVYGWQTTGGEAADAPEGWGAALLRHC